MTRWAALFGFCLIAILAWAVGRFFGKLTWQLEEQAGSDPSAYHLRLLPVFKYNFRGGNAHQRRIMRRERQRWANSQACEQLWLAESRRMAIELGELSLRAIYNPFF